MGRKCLSSHLYIFAISLTSFLSAITATAQPTPTDPFITGYLTRHKPGLLNLQRDKAPLLAFIESALAANGLPKELKSLAVIESYLDNRQVSVAGAAGPWQLMPATAREYGLRTDSADERFDIYKSTRVAVSILSHLYARYNDWYLVIAAYNGGSGRVDDAIARAGSHSFGAIEYLLPQETREHVKKYLATVSVLDGKMPLPAPPAPVAKDAEMLARRGLGAQYITSAFSLEIIAQRIGIPLADMMKLNPGITQKLAAKSDVRLLLPLDKMAGFTLNKTDILEASIAQHMAEPE